MGDTLRVGVIGAGHQGSYHLQKYCKLPDVQLAGVYDVDGSRARQAAEACGVPACGTLEQLLDAVDAVSVAVPPAEQVAVALAAMDRGVHCLLEKPLAPTSELAQQVVMSAESNGVVLHAGHVERFNPAFRALAAQAVRPRYIDAQRTAPWQPRGAGVSVVFDLMIHDLDLILSLMKAPAVNMDARGAVVLSDHLDLATVRVTFADGAVANISASRVASEKIRSLHVFEKSGWYHADLLQRRLTRSLYRVDEEAPDTDCPVEPADALEQEIRTFLTAVRGGKTPGAVTGVQAWKALCMAEDIERAILRIPW